MAEMIKIKENEKKATAVLVGLCSDRDTKRFERSMRELEELARACDLQVCSSITQNASEVSQATLVGSGKVEEIKSELYIQNADIVIFNQTLSPMQIRNLEKAFDTEVIDRTGLILQIFSERARTREAKLQVESAKLQYLLPRLSGMRSNLSRQGGGSGRLSNKGSGETKLELDRRHIEHRLSELRKELEGIDQERSTQRGKRLDSGITRVSLVGYTNAGKSTLLNKLLETYGGSDDISGKLVMEKDMLFATLDTTVRKITPDSGRPFLLTDTVGFIDELPHTLVKAFRSTLEEAKYADLLLEVIDFSDPDYMAHMEVTDKTLQEIGAGAVPRIYVFNKADLAVSQNSLPSADTDHTAGSNIISFQTGITVPYVRDQRIYMSAKTGAGIPELLDLIEKSLESSSIVCDMVIPYTSGNVLNELNQCGVIMQTEYLPEGTKIRVKCSERDAAKYAAYQI